MSGLRRGLKVRGAWSLIVSVLVVVITLAWTGIALADKWTDITDAQWQAQYGVTAAKAATVAGGFADGTFHPKEAVKRGQFAKMVVDGFGVAYYTPATATFPDVIKSNTFFKYVEGGVKAGIISGFTDGTFKPNNTVSRQQANNILGAYLAHKELDQNGVITGTKGTYASLSAWYGAEGALILAAFHDATKVAAVHAPGTAYLIYHEVVKGSNGNLTPTATLTRAQAVALIIRVRETTFGATGVPTVTGLNPAAGTANGGNGVIITGTNFTGAIAVKFGTAPAAAYTVNSATQITATAPPGTTGTTVDVTVTTAGGSSAASTGSKYSYGPPTLTALSPNGGSANGNTTVTITGTGFTGVSGVKFGSLAAKTYTVNSPTSITAVSPAGTNGTVVDVTVTTAAGTSATGTASKYTYGVPTITKLTPAAGAAAGGTSVVITGTGFVNVTGAAGVKFGTVNATSYVVNSSIQITAVAPAGTAGTSVDVIVTNDIGQSGATDLTTKYSYGPPTVTKISPQGGSEAGGETITITGTGFTGVSSVKFGTVAATNFSVTTPSVMTVTAPAGSAGSTVDITVTTPAGTSATSAADKYSYGAPTVTGVSPAAGPVAGNNSVVITGTNFSGITTLDQIKFGTKNCLAFVVNSSTQITATAPSGSAGDTVDVVVTNAAGASAVSQASKYSYGIPVVTSLDPFAGSTSGANSVVITGTGFTGVTAVKFGTTSVSYTVNSATKITAVAPAGALDTVIDVYVTNPVGTSVSSDATTATTDNSKYRYVIGPTVTSISPTTGPINGGNTVTIDGTYFVDVQSVKFGTKAATNVVVVSDTELTCTAPSGTSGTVVHVTVTNPVGVSPITDVDEYSYGIPTVTNLNPAARSSDTGSSTVVITGTAFSGVTSVRFYYDMSDLSTNYVAATSYTVNSLTQITAVVPDYDSGLAAAVHDGVLDKTVDVVVTNGTGSSASSGASKYAYGPPTIVSLTPAGGAAAGGNSVVITGYGFTGTASSMQVIFGTAPATITSINTAPVDVTTTAWNEAKFDCTKITVTAPAQGSMTSPVDVVVTTAAGPSSAASYSYGVPIVTKLSPAAGLSDGGNSIVITGSGFTSGSKVRFGSTLTEYTPNFDSSTQLTVVVPSGLGLAGKTVDVYVTNSGGTSAKTSADLYSFGAPTVTSITPNGGPAGTTVLIEGTGFTGVQNVRFVGSSTYKTATVVSVTPDYTDTDHGAPQAITVTSPTGLTGTVDVIVTTDAGSSTSVSADEYSYGIPTVTLLSPAAGKAAGGTTVLITGTNFDADNTTVYFDGVPLDDTDVDVTSETRISVTTPAAALLPDYDAATHTTIDVQVANGSGTSLTSAASKYSYGVPIVHELDPTGGLAAGGNTVKIYGQGFSGVTSVKFGSKNATSWSIDTTTYDDAWQVINAVAPAGTVGTTVKVTVTNAFGASSTSGTECNYTYGIPTVTGLNPAAGMLGDLVIITGTNFTGVTDVVFGGTSALIFVVNSATQITAQVPAGTTGTTVDVQVKNGAAESAITTADKFSYGAPTISEMDPNYGPIAGGTTVTIYGTGFTGIQSIMFGDTAGTSINVDETTLASATQKLTVRAPAGTVGTTVTVVITTAAGHSDLGSESDITEPWDYHYGVPTVTNLKEGSGISGEQVVITGTNFTDDAQVFFGDTEVTTTIDYDSIPTKLVVYAPTHADGTVDVTVVTGAGTSATTLLTTKWTYGAPTISTVSPASGAGGQTLVLTGSGFTGVQYVKVSLGGTTKTAVISSIDSTTQMKITAPSFTGLHGTATIEITTHGGTDTATFTYL